MLRNQIQHLENKRDVVQRGVDAATRNGEEIKADVRRWQTDVDDIMADAKTFFPEFDAKKRYLKWWRFNLRLRYRLSKEATRILYIVMGLLGKGENTPPPGIKAVPAFFPPSVDSLSVSLPAPPAGIEAMSSKDFVAFKSTKSSLDQIFKALRDENCNMVGLWGMGGVGKTTLVKEVGKKVKEQKLFDEVVMAVVSQNQDVRKIQGQIADMLGLTLTEESESGRAGRLIERLKQPNRVLIILDDVWEKLDLNAVGIPHGDDHKGCKIILTTREEPVCTAMGNHPKTKKIHVDVLPKEESWDLFRRHVEVDIDSPPWDVPATDVVGKCKGLPIALKTVGRALRGKNLEDWKAAVQQLKKSKPANIYGMDKDVISCIRLSYDYLPDEETKLCFLFCCLFPEDYEIEIEYLARYAVGKGFIKDVDSMVEARSRVHNIIKNLKASCMLLQAYYENYVKMHDIVRDVAISIASGGNDDLFLVRAGAGLKFWPRMGTFESYTGISLMTNDLQELPQGLKCPKLQILLLGQNEDLEAIPEAFFEGMGMLKVLDLSKRFLSLPPSLKFFLSTSERILSLPPSLKFLANLQTLHLNNCKLGNLSALCTLKKLEILSFYGSDIRALPEEIGELINLRLLDLTRCYNLNRIPSNVISQLTRLEELYMGASFGNWEVEGTSEERSSASLSELTKLPCLTILCVDVHDVACFPDNFPSQNMLSFEISVGCRSIGFYPNSRRLRLSGVKTPLSNNVKTLLQTIKVLNLSNMSGSLEIEGCIKILEEVEVRSSLRELVSIWNGSSSVVSLCNLTEVTIDECTKLSSLFSPSLAQSLSNLETLKIKDCWKLETIVAEDEGSLSNNYIQPVVGFPNLKFIQVRSCKRLKSLFTIATARGLVKLKEVSLYGNEELQEIVSHGREGEEEEGDEKEILWPQLEILQLSWHTKLKRLCPESFNMDLPSLKELKVDRCPMLNSFAANGLNYESYLEFQESLLEDVQNLFGEQ